MRPSSFAGHSMGGSMALDYAIHYPEDVEGLILVGAAPEWEMPARDLDVWKTDPDSAHEANIGLLVSRKTSRRIVDDYAKQLAGQTPEACIADYVNCNKYDLLGRIGEIQVPALVAAGDEETWIEGSRQIHSSNMNTTFEIIPAAGHAVMIEQPTLLNDAIGAYLSTLS